MEWKTGGSGFLCQPMRYPAKALVGPRQCGKTTLAQSIPGIYFDLEQSADRLRLDLEWDDLISGKEWLIPDEAQSWPEVYLYLL